jgi:hypothetical protein
MTTENHEYLARHGRATNRRRVNGAAGGAANDVIICRSGTWKKQHVIIIAIAYSSRRVAFSRRLLKWEQT